MFKPGDIVESKDGKGKYVAVVDVASSGICVLADESGSFFLSHFDNYKIAREGAVDVSSFVREVENKIEMVREREAGKRKSTECLEQFLRFYCPGKNCKDCAFSDGIICCIKAVIERELK